MAGSYFAISLTFVFHPSKDCLSTRLQSPKTTGGHCWGRHQRYYAIHFQGVMTEPRVRKLDLSSWSVSATSWVTLLNSPDPFTSLHDLFLLTTFSPSDREPSLDRLYVPSCSLAHRFLNSAQRSSQWVLFPRKSLSAAKDLRHFSAPHMFPVPSPHTYLSKSNPELTGKDPQSLSEYFLCPPELFVSLSCPSFIVGSSKGRSALLSHSP